MRHVLALALCAALAAPSMADLITTQHFNTFAEVQAYLLGGLEFVARGDTELLRLTRANPPGVTQLPFTLWNDGIAHGFKVVYNAGGIAGLSIDDLYTIQTPVTIDPATNGLLVTACADGTGRSVVVSNLKITLPGFLMYNVGDLASAPETDYMLIGTALPLAGGFILSGTVTFNWEGSIPPAPEQWFEVAPVVVPEPAMCTLACAAGLWLLHRPRR
jgi:hypothetical protein